MNKTEFLKSFSSKTDLSWKDANLVNKILENNFFIYSKNKDKIVSELVIKLKIDQEKANNIYKIAKSILDEEIKNKLKHPFKSRD